ncbi:uncharacterized protein LOC134793737 isoform X2 [Cydia splendana]|uniref:uncharacterized protein LOC134793737 isoform X2 n=1 Tax=Cydia splendana TaxID=1100963 RepID=UPI0028F4759C
MGFRMNYLFIGCLLASIYSSNGCTMEGVTTWQLPITVGIEDYHEGIVLQRAVADIGGFTLTSSSDLNQGPYIVASLENSAFVLRTNDAYRLFEEYETADLISLTYAFTCTNGQTPSSPLTIRIEINDNNNNPPLWKTPDTAASETTTYEFTIATPVPPGFLITNCVSDIIVRDIDLTTYRIDFGIEDNPYIGIEYDEAASTDAKEFKAVLKSTAFIRSISEPIILTISATDVDLTGDPPITRSTTVTIHGSSDFELPLEPIFSQAFYLASYTENDQVTVEQPITLEQGYDELVQFSLEGDYAIHFAITVNGNLVTLSVTDALPAAALQEGRIYLVVRASREDTSGASATIVVELPEVVHLEFERPHYEGEIADNTLHLTQLILSQGYEGSVVTVTVEDYSSFFSATVVGNTITLSMTPLDDSIIQQNNFINLRVTASTGYSSATTIVTLEIVKDDVTTPVFDQSLYTGTYDPAAGLTVEPILLAQGYDETVSVTLFGEYESYFELTRDGPSSTLRVAGDGLPSHILSQSHLHLSVEAAKPRTVGASAVVAITLPGAREMQFEAQSYKGSVQDNILSLDTIILSVGYEEDVTFSLSGDYSTSFVVSNVQNQVTINMPAQLPQEVISENNFLMLTLSAEGVNALPTTTAVLLEIIKADATTPVFSQPIYDGTYLGSLGVELGNINLIQGYDSSVTFRIQGENSEYFSITQNENSVTLTVQSSIPEDVIFQEKAFVFNIFADKPLTVGANAAIVVRFSEDLIESTVMEFAKNTYIGSLENNELALENIVLETGFAVGTQFYLSGDYAESFTHTVTANIVTLSMTSELPAEALENNKFIVLELEARRDRAVSVVTGIIIDIVEGEIITPVFSQAYYSGVYTEENALQFQDVITLTQGFDDTVTFGLEGESAGWFAVEWIGNSVTVVSTSPLPQDVLDSYHQLLFTVVAYKPNSINGRAAISVELPTDLLEQEVLRFVQSSYEGQLDGSQLQVPTITLSNQITENVIVSISGAYATYFTATRDSNTVHIELLNELPSEIITNNEFIVLDIIASKTDAVSGYTALILSIVKEPIIVTPVFEQAYYTGEISEQGELLFEHTMRLIQGFDESVSFTLSGDGSERFILTQTGQNSLSLSITQGGIEGIENISHFVFSVVASKAGSVSGHAAIVIHNTDSSTARTISFSRNHYTGTLEDNVLNMEAISIVEGYGSDVYLTLSGDYMEYFQLVGQDGTYTLQLVSNVPNEIIEAHTMLVYTLEANGDNGRTHATVIVELVKSNEVIEALGFDGAYYVGSYSATTGLMADILLRVVTGYDSDTVFTVQGDNSAWFFVQHSESMVTISLAAPLPVELFIDNQPVIFAINAVNSGGSTAVATIVVSLEGELSELTVLGFERSSYLGTIESDTSTLQPIILTQGYSTEVYFTLQGDLSNYFTINQQGSSLNVVLESTIPASELPANGIIVLELQATAVQAVSATTTIVFEVADGEDLSFSAAYYIGQYSETEGLTFDTISLDMGYDQDVQFSLEGENAQWFALQVQGNTVALIMTSAIPPTILADNHQLVFMVKAQKEESRSNIATATIVISLIDESTVVTILSFEQTSYLGSIANDALSIEPIVLNEGYTEAVTLTLFGDLASYFNLQQQGSTVNIVLQSSIPEETLPANGIVLLDLQASAPQAINATTTIVIETQSTAYFEELAFSAAYYVGEYSETGGFTFDSIISLDVGYDLNVEFTLEGEHSQWFALEVQANAVTLTVSSAIPPAILVNNHHLVFIITAQKANSNIERATIIISLIDDYTDAIVLGFEQANYLGSIENDALTIEPIVLNEGYTDAVTFTLTGDVASYFNLQQQGSTVNIILQSAIPEETMPTNGILLLELRASASQAIAATTTVVIEVQQAADIEELAFSAAYYIGEYSENSGLSFDSIMTLDVGYDQNVQFSLEGEHSQWFALEVQGNAVTLTMSGAIPPAILVNNHQLVFHVTAQKANSNIARATMIISLIDDYTDAIVLGFERANYLGSIENDAITIEPIVLNEGYTDDVTFTLSGDLALYFNLQQQGSTVNIVLQSAIPEETIPANRILLLELRASAPQAIAATTTVVIEAQRAADIEDLTFSAAFYIGEYSENSGLAFDSIISLDVGYDQSVQFSLEGEHSQWFALEVQGNAVTLTMSGAIPPAILVNNHQLAFLVTAQKANSNLAIATIIISLIDDYTDAIILGFERANYLGSIENDALTIEPIVLNEGYTDAVTFTLSGDLASYFSLQQLASTVNIVLQSEIPDQLLPANGIVLLELRASRPQAIAATTTVVIETQRTTVVEELVFSAAYYIGEYSETSGLAFDATISLDVGYDQNVQFGLEGEHAQWFGLQVQGNAATLTLSIAIPPSVLVNNHQLVFTLTAEKPNSNTAKSTMVISLVDDYTDAPILGFEQASYLGSIENNALSIEPIVLNEGYTDDVTFTLFGDLASYFSLQQQGATVNIVLQSTPPEQVLPANGILLLQLRASATQSVPATATIVIEVQRAAIVEELAFTAAYYTGEYSESGGLAFETAISLDTGYDNDVLFTLEGDNAQWFALSIIGNSITLVVEQPIPPAVLVDLRKIIMIVRAVKSETTASTIIIISIIDDSGSVINEAFDKILYEGTINNNVLQHEPITITGHAAGIDIEILGVYRELFSASVSGDTVVVGDAGNLNLPEGVSHVALELRAGSASAVVIFEVIQSETPELPTVAFESPSYVLRADMTQTGVLGLVQATASNGESIAYSLAVDDAHLRERISINSVGEIHLSAPTNTGVYSFQAIATSTITQVQATTAVQLTVEVVATCGDDHALPPLIILDRDEEEPHTNLVVLDSEAQAGCQFRLTNRWPLDQDWLYVDNTGLHARAIDREDLRIAFMALSQVQVELVLECDSDTQNRAKRSTVNPRLDWLGPYEYGSNRWILTDTILYNSRRSFVNLIVNDINDNYPIFVGNENEPIVCGYPIPELEDIVLPRALAELKATDADVGENAALSFWSASEVLAVASTTGYVHVRDGASLSQDQRLVVSVTDLNGREDGLTTSIELLVKLLDTSHIAVVTVRNAFLDQEQTILENLSSAVEYEVKVLSSAVISDDQTDSANTRHKREVTTEGASLQLYVYGLIDREPVAVDQLTNDITRNLITGVDVTSTVSLEDYLEGREIYGGGRDTGLLVATIVLSILLFILMLLIALWFFLRWRKARNYEQFSDANSLASHDESLESPQKIDSLRKPRLNIDELKRSERRLQEMLDAPIEEVSPKAQTSQVDPKESVDTVINMAPTRATDVTLPIVIQSIDKLKDDENSGEEDEFGERKNKSRRKSVVTFNENVEKIIHVEDIPDDNSSDLEIYKF